MASPPDNNKEDNAWWGPDPIWVDQDDDPEAKEEYSFGAEHVVCLLDGSSSSSHYLDMALQACERLCRNRILHTATTKTGKRDCVAVLLYGVEKRPSKDMQEEDEEEEEDEGNIMASTTHVLFELQPPSSRMILSIRECLHDEIQGGRRRDLSQEYTPTASAASPVTNLKRALQEANKLLTDSKVVKKGTKSKLRPVPPDAKYLWVFTPSPMNRATLTDTSLTTVWSDLTVGGNWIQIYPLVVANEQDDTTNILPPQVRIHPFVSLEDLIEKVPLQSRKPRIVWRLPLLMPGCTNEDEPQIMVDVYKLIRPQTKPQPVWIQQSTKRPTAKVTQTTIATTGQVLMGPGGDLTRPSDRLLYYTNMGTERIPLLPQDVTQIKSSGCQPQIRLIGFQPLATFSLTLILDTPYCIYPNNDLVQGSKEALCALFVSMKEKQVYGLAELLVRNSTRLVALVPEEDGQMLLMPLPFQDDVRTMHVPTSSVAEEDLIQAMSTLMSKQQLRDIEIGIDLENSAVHRFWSYVEATSLNMPLPEEDVYETELDEEEIIKALGDEIQAVVDLLPEDEDKKKRATAKAAGRGGAAAGRKRKTPVLEEDTSGVDWVAMYRSNSIADCKVAELKSYCKSVGKPQGGRKDDMVLRVENSIQTRIRSGEIQ